MKVNAATRLVKNTQTVVPDTHVFCQLTKVDKKNRIVYGRAVQEVPDASGEIFDYKSSKPYFEKWVDETKEASGGKSLGNIRSMHGNIAAGKAVEVTFHDDECAIDIAAKVVDNNEWDKVVEGVYTGFSIGGSYVGKKVKDGDLMRYTAAPVEISLVDKPCIPTAMFFDIVKSKGFQMVEEDGVEKHAEFKLEAEAPKAAEEPPAPVKKTVTVDEDPAPAQDIEIEGTPEQVLEFGKLMQDNALDLSKVAVMVKQQLQVDAPKRFADKANKKYPLDNNEQVLAAWYFVNTTKAQALYTADEFAAVKAEVVDAYKSRFNADPEAIDAEAADKALSPALLQKSFYNVASASSLLQSLSYFLEEMKYWEGQESVEHSVLGKVVDMVSTMGEVIAGLIAAEAASLTETEELSMARVTQIRELAEGLLKAGFMSSKDEKKKAKKMQKLHDMVKELGATCAAEKGTEPDDLHKHADSDTLAKMVKQVEALAEQVTLLKAQPAAPKAVLRVVSKGQDNDPSGTGDDPDTTLSKAIAEMRPVIGSDGKVDAAATVIKFMHRAGGQPARP